MKVDLVGASKETQHSLCMVEVETDSGVIGHGFTAITEEEVIVAIVRDIAAPAIIGEDPMAHERVWDRLYWTLCPRGQTGYASHAIAAIDIALWDIKGKVLGQPIWRLLGGARDRVPVYATFGFSMFDRSQLVDAAKLWVSQGHRRLKMVVGHEALRRRDARTLREVVLEDYARVAAVRDAVGKDIELFIDANCSLDRYHAVMLARMCEPLNISFFEEPITQNDVLQMAEMRRQTTVPLAAGQNEGLSSAFGTCCCIRRSMFSSPMSPSAAGIRSARRLPAWPRHSMCRSPTAGPGPITTCISMRAWQTAHWSNTTTSRFRLAAASIRTSPCLKTVG